MDEADSVGDLVERCRTHGDVTWDDVRKVANRDFQRRGEWAGVPIPVDNLRLVLEPRYPCPALDGMKLDNEERGETDLYRKIEQVVDWMGGRIHLINSWHCRSKQRTVYVYHTGDGRSKVFYLDDNAVDTKVHFIVTTMGASRAWSAAAEIKAQQKLKTLLPSHLFDLYVLTGTFPQTSKRSGLTYIFRKGRPTLAVRDPGTWEPCRVIAALCLHPIGFYEDSFGGCMVPTDDVIAHLMLMRGDEWKFWSKSNHHPLESVNSGI